MHQIYPHINCNLSIISIFQVVEKFLKHENGKLSNKLCRIATIIVCEIQIWAINTQAMQQDVNDEPILQKIQILDDYDLKRKKVDLKEAELYVAVKHQQSKHLHRHGSMHYSCNNRILLSVNGYPDTLFIQIHILITKRNLIITLEI